MYRRIDWGAATWSKVSGAALNMFVDARTLPNGFTAEAEVCIVGAGAAGITIARALGRRRRRVVLLESGWLQPDPETQSLYAGEVRDRPYFALESARTRTRYFGGTTNEWSGECRPLSALDFEAREWVPDSGWPFGLAELLPYYERAQAVCQLGRFAYTATDWPVANGHLIPFQSRRVRSDVFHYSPPTRFGEVYRAELQQSDDVVAYLGANVVGLETPSPPTRVQAARVACLTGNNFRVRARIVVLAAGGIENARLLLLSSETQPAGLGNTYDLVGRYFMEHVYLNRAATLVAVDGAISDFYTDGVRTADGRVRGILDLAPELQQAERLTHFCSVIDAEWDAPLGALAPAVVRAAGRRLPPSWKARAGRTVRRILGTTVGRAMRSMRRRRYLFKTVMEQAPNAESRVMLSRERDRLGCPRVALHWSLTSVDKRTLHRAHEVLDEELTRAGIGSLDVAVGSEDGPWPPGIRGARHHMGTTRMHRDVRRGVVDADCRVHGTGNLYVAGSSVFPTSGAANPTLTIVALAIRLAEHLDRALEEGRAE